MHSRTNIITIEKNVPIPSVYTTHDRTKYNFLKSMEVGDSFSINGNTPDYKPNRVRAYMYKMNSNPSHGRKYTVRTIRGTTKFLKEIRVWRIK